MEEIIQDELSKGVELHIAGEFDLAARCYESVIKQQPDHADANYNMGLLKLDIGLDLEALPYLQTALQADTSIAQFWLSYIKALIKLEKLKDASRILNLAKENGIEGDDFEKLHQSLNSSPEGGNIAGNELFNPNQTEIDLFDGTEVPKYNEEDNLKLSKKGLELINLYKDMVVNGYERTDGSKVTSTYNDFELRKFRSICKTHFQKKDIETVLDYGGGGSDWDAPNFEPSTNESAKQFFKVKDVCTYEPARNLFEKRKSDCVVCMDVLEHIHISDVPRVVDELFSLSKKLLVVNVACYKAAAMLPTGENAHITVRSPDWWKGLIDAISINYEEVEVALICSQTYSSGVIFETFRSGDWNETEGFSVPYNYRTFGAK